MHLYLSQRRPGGEVKTEEPSHNVEPNRSVMMRKMRRMTMRHRGKGGERRRPGPETVMKMMKKTAGV